MGFHDGCVSNEIGKVLFRKQNQVIFELVSEEKLA